MRYGEISKSVLESVAFDQDFKRLFKTDENNLAKQLIRVIPR